MQIVKYNMFNKLKVVRWSTKIIPANELEFQLLSMDDWNVDDDY